MEPKTKKILLITCGTLTVLVILSCIGITVFLTVYGEKVLEGGLNLLAGTLEEAIVADLPEGVDEQEARRLFRRVWDDVISRLMNQEINQRKFDKLMNQDFQNAIADEQVTPDEFDYLVDQCNEVIYDSLKDPGKLERLKQVYRQAKDDDEFSEDEVNELIRLMNDILASPEEESGT